MQKEDIYSSCENVKPKYTWKEKIGAIGPGAMITASFIGPGTITTATRVGAGLGYALLWTVLFSVIATIILQEMSARLGIVTKNGLGEAIVKQFDNELIKRLSVILVGGSILLGCISYISGDLSGTALGLSTMIGVESKLLGPVMGAIVFAIVYKGSPKFLEKFLTILVGIMAVVFLTTMFVAKPDMKEVFSGLKPTVPKGSLIFIISMIGTTVVPYNFFIHAASAKNNFKSTDELELSKWDTYFSITIGGLITAAVLITSATLMKGVEVKSAADMAIQLEPLLGSWSKTFMSIGLFAAGLSSAIATPLGASYTLAGLLGWGYDNNDKRFRNVNLAIVVIGSLASGLGINPLTIILVAQALNGIILPVIAIYLVYITSSKKQLGVFANSKVQIALGSIVALITVVLGTSSLIDAIKTFAIM